VKEFEDYHKFKRRVGEILSENVVKVDNYTVVEVTYLLDGVEQKAFVRKRYNRGAELYSGKSKKIRKQISENKEP